MRVQHKKLNTALETVKCAYCGEEFTPHRGGGHNGRITCSKSCAMKMSRNRTKGTQTLEEIFAEIRRGSRWGRK